MKETVVLFETAQLADLKGFNLETGSVDYMVDGNYIGSRGACTSCTKYVKAPSQSLLQKWLRDEHQIYVDIETDMTSSPKFCYTISRFIGTPQSLSKEEWGWEKIPAGKDWYLERTYESALESGLIEALKQLQ